ncbi:MAG TPA: hypothetical protein VNL18_07360 [Gemmatimonadales bacterium]|nr:hypothetical protein [Gemmatimonadales bacterium]
MKPKAISTAGLGFDFVVPDGVKKPKPENNQVLKDFFNHPNDEMTWGEILENVLTDFEALGNGYFEVVRNRFGTGRPTAIYHIPAVTMRDRKDKKGLIQQRDNKTVYVHHFRSDPQHADSFGPRDKDKRPKNRRLPNIHPRMAAQHSYFTVHGSCPKPLCERVGASCLKKYLLNIPDRDGAMRHLRRLGVAHSQLCQTLRCSPQSCTVRFWCGTSTWFCGNEDREGR